ncbi:hypothetical protein [Alteromonas confluentis]|uniref:Uncharacterized protein n=1 Tax=Alteromonas confluentis TaxID=1656094 RepID=A0A1E7Z8J3_9ALTE|nr:hypothetical protein [Alteromonas confluentis]OFC69849.1 hypothetical protein BFC18_16160 [Alteromonas confluentis]
MSWKLNNNKKWVYECLVESETDPVGLIAYAFYKKSKHDLASKLRNEKLDEPEIEKKVKAHHDTVLQSTDLLESFNLKAELFLKEVYQRIESKVEDELQKEHKKKVDELEKEKKNAYDKATQALKSAAKKHNEPHWCLRSLGWLWNGFAGIFAALIMTFLLGGVIYSLSPEAKKAESKQEVVTEILNYIFK